MKLHRNEKFFKWGLTAFLAFVACAVFWIVFSNLNGFYDLIMRFLGIISPILYGCLFAYFMNPIMKATMKLMAKLIAKRKKPLKEATAEKLSVTVAVLLLFALIPGAVIFWSCVSESVCATYFSILTFPHRTIAEVLFSPLYYGHKSAFALDVLLPLCVSSIQFVLAVVFGIGLLVRHQKPNTI